VNNEHSFRDNSTTPNANDWAPTLRRAHDFASLDSVQATNRQIATRPATTPPPLRNPAQLNQTPLRPTHGDTARHIATNDGHGALTARGNPAETDFLIESRHGDEDPPFQVPAIWNAQAPAARHGAMWDWSERSTAAFLGFAAGVLVVVPTVLYLGSGTEQDGFSAASTVPPPAVIETTAVANADAPITPAIIKSDAGGGIWFAPGQSLPSSTPATSAAPTSGVATVGEQPSTIEATRQLAQTALDQGRLSQARAILRDSASPEAPQLWFQLAETYDPQNGNNQRAVPGKATGDLMSAADIEFARYYYQRALTYGVHQARARLAALAGP
jgi:hypothetical protein